jgi:hypothetical protein
MTTSELWDQLLEALLGGAQLGRPLHHPGLQVAGQREVLEQAQDLAPDQGEDDERPGPGGEVVEDALLDLGDRAHRQRPDHGDVGQEHADAVDAGLGLLLVDLVGFGLAGGQQEQQVAEEPAGVDQPARGVGLGGGQVDEAAVGHGDGHQPPAEQGQRGPAGAAAHARPGQDEQDDGADDHVADRVGQADRLGDEVLAAGPEHRAQHHHPAGQQQRGRDHQAVQHLAGPADQARGGEGQADEGGRGQWGRGQVADVGQRGEGDIAAQDRLVPGPGGLAAAPGQRRGAQQLPHPLLLLAGEAGAALAGDAGRPGRRDQPEVGDGLAGPRATQPPGQGGQPEQGHDGHGRALGEEAALGC